MQELQCLVFGPFRLDLRDERLWRDHEATPLSPKTFAVLRCLVTQAAQLVTKDALLEAVWPATVVSESVVTVAVRNLTCAGTSHRRGLKHPLGCRRRFHQDDLAIPCHT